ncbi:MAG: hypothetical protein ACRD8O_14880 [Bryobacteraceae bacterium]
METTLRRLTLTFRSDGAVDAIFVRKGRSRRHHEIRARFNQYGWQQWGEPCFILGDNVCLIERIRRILDEEGVAR